MARFTNQAQLRYGDSITNSNIAVGEILEVLSAAKTADTGAVITDTFDPILSDLAVTFNDTAWAETTNYTYDATTGDFATVAGQITVPAATYAQNPTTGTWAVTPGVSTLIVTGTV